MTNHNVGDEVKLKMSVKTLLGILGVVLIAAASWFNIKADVSSHSTQLQAISTTVGADHDQLKVQGTLIEQQSRILERMDRKIDFLTGASRVRPSATPSQP